MKTITQEKLDLILKKNRKWLNNEEGGERANLRGVDLHGANLQGIGLRCADLRWADLYGAKLQGANLHGTDLHGANLRGADLSGADLHGADLSGTNLREANLREADLRDVDLSGADLSGANLTNTKLPDFQIPQNEILIGYKKCKDLKDNQYVVTLEIPKEARRTASLIGNKCRCEFAKVIKIEKINKNNKLRTIKDENFEVDSCHNSDFKYKLNQVVKPDSYNDDIREECTNGIHFFVNKQDAINY